MQLVPALLPSLIQAIEHAIETNAEEVTALDQAIGDGDHVTNLQRGIKALMAQSDELAQLDWVAAWQKIGMTLMTAVGGVGVLAIYKTSGFFALIRVIDSVSEMVVVVCSSMATISIPILSAIALAASLAP